MHFILILLTAVALVLLALTLTSPGKLSSKKQNWKWLAGFFVAILLILVATGRLHWIGALIAGAIPLVRNLVPMLLRYFPQIHSTYRHVKANSRKQQQASGSGHTSTVATTVLEMTLNHDTGSMSGVVLSGRFKGQHIEDLDLPQLLDLLKLCEQDGEDSKQLLEAYLDARFGQQWRNTTSHTSSQGSMSRQQAYQILGLQEGATREAIIAAHKKLMQKFHPDRGGNDYLAAQINLAKRTLLND